MSQYKLICTEERIKSEQQLFILLKDLSLRFHVIACKAFKPKIMIDDARPASLKICTERQLKINIGVCADVNILVMNLQRLSYASLSQIDLSLTVNH